MKPFFLFLALLVSQTAFSAGFTAICDASETHAYRSSASITEQSLGAGWTSDEVFFDKWTFVFDGKGQLLLDGEAVQVLHWDGVSLMALDYSSSSNAASAWLYAFNLDLKDVVGSQVNSYLTIASGIKAGSTKFDCEFTHHAS